MSLAHSSWRPVGSTESPMIFTSRRSNSGLIFAMYPSSVVHTGVKSFGCEKRTAQESPIQSWNLIGPSVVSASKSGAVSPICKAMLPLLLRGFPVHRQGYMRAPTPPQVAAGPTAVGRLKPQRGDCDDGDGTERRGGRVGTRAGRRDAVDRALDPVD